VPVERAALYILQACEGMAEVHAHGIVHRDLKPSNLFLTQRPDGSPLVKVLDFGIAKGVTVDAGAPALTQTLVGLGTPLYMSPEQIRSSREVDARADVWSLGTIFYELLTGKPAFGGMTLTHITAQVLESQPMLPSALDPSLPRAADDIVLATLAKSPDARAVDVAALASMLEPLAGPAGAGAAARCARILGGALRSEVISSAPVARDDPAGGTRRFDRQRRVRRLRVAVAVRGVAAVGLVVAAAAVYRDGAGTAPPPLAKRGLEMQSTRAALFAATKLDSDAPEPAPSDAAPAVVLGSDSATPPSSSAAAALPGLATGARPPGAGATASAGTGPGNTGAGNSSPGTAGPGNMGAGSTGAGSTGAGKAWNPFDERN
jgi:serine/threonine-protein kinase